MKIMKMDKSALEPEFGILCQRLEVEEAPIRAPFGSAWCVTEPGGSSSPDEHPDTEMVVVVRGQGTVMVDSEETDIAPGMVICVPPHTRHIMRNDSQEDPLITLNLFWVSPETRFDR